MRILNPFLFLAFLLNDKLAAALKIVIAGGTGKLGRSLSEKLTQHNICVLCRNAFLAATPARVSGDYGWLGEGFLDKNDHVRLRDWDGGDLLDIVGNDFLGWQDDALKGADVVLNLVGGFTEQRTMAAERIIRESLRVNPKALQICVSPVDEEVGQKIRRDRVKKVEDMYKVNCNDNVCLRLEYNSITNSCDAIINTIENMES